MDTKKNYNINYNNFFGGGGRGGGGGGIGGGVWVGGGRRGPKPPFPERLANGKRPLKKLHPMARTHTQHPDIAT